ncbi:MAG: hypothetical protein EXX96DRAFT_575275 [Benjaminiella poitrasii]|nr:MAG: hypothetical protein EXX96DRAFT_575275 [Benjaminiella poitrasii]
MPTTISVFRDELEKIPDQLKLIHCATILQTSSDLHKNKEALKYLRIRATAHHDVEAKTKLSILYNEEDLPCLVRDEAEVNLWSRSIFDKQLSQALEACASILSETDDLSTLHFLQEIIKTKDIATKDDSIKMICCYLAGLLYTKGVGFEQSLEKGIDLLKLSVTVGRVAEAGCELGRIYGDRYRYSLNQPAEAMHWFHRAFEYGSTQAVVDLAYGFFEGHGQDVPKDDTRALRYAKEGALLNDKYCQYILGHLYLKGKSISGDAKEAIRWLHASAQQGFAVAIEEETSVYMYGHGNVKQDYEKAYQCCMQPSAMNIPFCQARLGDMYRNTWGVSQDFHKAFEYYQNAASQSDSPYPYAQHMLGEMFLHGEGVPKDLAVAKEWFQIASTQGYEPSQIKLQQIELLENNIALQHYEQHEQRQQQNYKQQEQQEKKSSRWSLNFFNKK